MKNIANFTVFGNPISQSKSPFIQQLFAEFMQKEMHYTKTLGDIETFEQQFKSFFAQGGMGCNITAPFKTRAFALADTYSISCELAQAANTCKKLADNSLYVDNTDGIGLVSDLQRLNWLDEQQNILILGAGGATQGILYPLLQAKQKIVLGNRDMQKAINLKDRFQEFGEITAYSLAAIPQQKYGIIINTIPNQQVKELALDKHLFSLATAVYDLAYNTQIDTNFIALAKQYGITKAVDGRGMLIYQGAHAFNLWWDCELSAQIIDQVFTKFNVLS